MIIEVERSNLSETRIRDDAPAPLDNGQARIRIDAFALSSNNITYAVFGEVMQYWDFFPAVRDDATTWGRIPAWGFGEVVETTAPECTVGERLYGFFPMASELVITPGRADERSLTDIAAHRAPMAGPYNRYVRCARDPIFRAERERHQMLLYPLFFTSFLVDDFLVDNADFGAQYVVVSSASSKTAIGVAYLAHRRGQHAVGLTSASNRAFVEALGIYDRVLSYDELSELDHAPSVYIDIAGNSDVRHAVHECCRGMLEYSMTVGSTHWDHPASSPAAELAAPAPVFFFAPSQVTKRTKEWGADELDRRMGAAWGAYSAWVDGWIEFHDVAGPDAVIGAYVDLLHGAPDPRAGFIGSLPMTGVHGA